MLRENQLGTRSMVNAVTDEFWSMVESSINEQAMLFKSAILLGSFLAVCDSSTSSFLFLLLLALRYNLEAEWRNKFPGERTLDRVCAM